MTGTQVVVTSDALELLVQVNDTIQILVEEIKSLHAIVAEVKLSTIQPIFLTTEQLGAYINVAPATLRKYRSEGLIGRRTPMPPSVSIGDKVLWPKADVDKWSAEQPRFTGRKGKEDSG